MMRQNNPPHEGVFLQGSCMSHYRVVISGDWEEGKDIIGGQFSDSPVFVPETIDFSDVRLNIRRTAADAYVFCMKGSCEDLYKRLEEIKKFNEGLPVFVFAHDSDVSFAVGMLKSGVVDHYVRPLDSETFLKTLEREVRLYNLTKKVFIGGRIPFEGYVFENMIGRSRKMQDNFQMIAAVAKSNATVLITGESGVGKELVAKALHRLSERSKERFVDINCGAIPHDLLENELFGHEKGSFTGAHKRYIGSFEAAHKGTLFLDEISEMDVLLQVKLLRVLQERSFSRIGGNEKINIDVRIVAATNCVIQSSIEKGEFREDLYYRLNVINIDIPPLRERREDIPLLSKHFLDYYSAKNNRIIVDFSNDAMEALINYDWPGNVRELENSIERIVVLNDVTQVRLKHLPEHIQHVDRSIGYTDEPGKSHDDIGVIPLEDLERQAIEAALLKFHGNISVAAKKLKIGQATLYRKVKKFGIVT